LACLRSLAGAGHVNEIADLEHIRLDDGAELQLAAVVEGELAQVLLGGNGRIFKGTGGPGQMGGETVTIQNLEVVKVDPELNMLVVRGAIPGPKFSLVTVKNTIKTHKVKQAGAGISSNPQKASGRNPQKASARTK